MFRIAMLSQSFHHLSVINRIDYLLIDMKRVKGREIIDNDLISENSL